MVLKAHELIAGIIPERYFLDEDPLKKNLKEFQTLVKEKGPVLAVTEFQKAGKLQAKAETVHKLVYESPTETLEPIYFFILDLMNDMGFGVEKLVDNFVSSPGSGHFGEMGQRANIMQQNASKLLGDINTVLRSMITLIYDLREFKIRLEHYKKLKSDKQEEKDAAMLSLKQMWMDKVDINKGNSAIKVMSLSQAGFVTLLDAFLYVKDEKDVDKLDLNDIVKRILKPRIQEFKIWVHESEIELDKRYKIERAYLKSQEASLRTYVNWAKPYLRAAEELRMDEKNRHPALVKMFNTMLLELTLMADKKDSEQHQIILVDFEFRGIPQRTQQGYVAGGKTEITFRAYGFTNDELKSFKEAFEESDLFAGLELIQNITTDSLGALSKDIKEFIDEENAENKGETPKKEEKKKGPRDTSNPILALFGAYNEPKTSAPKSKEKEKKPDKFNPEVGEKAAETTFTIFEIYKKAHGMVAFP
ncbi:hypothetical protein GW931_02750 [archaeon]|nr:hypothetical protein [archaeon]